MSKTFDDLLKKLSSCSMKKVSVAAAQDSNVLEAVAEAKKMGIADAILVGDCAKMNEIAKAEGVDLSSFEIIDEPDMTMAAHKAVSLVHDGKADMYMKGVCDTKTFLKSVLDKEVGLRTGKPLSHVCVFEVEGINRLLFLTDVAFIPYPTLEDKVIMIDYAVEVARACGIETPKVAPLCAVEVVNDKMQETLDAAELTKMNEEGKIKNCIVDGPLSLDLAIDPEAAIHKGATGRKIVGDADILLFPDIHAGNILYKGIVHLAKAKNGNILTGTKAPVVVASRSDSKEVKMYSMALAAIIAEEFNKQKGE
ncbi:MAG: phosphate butyryltransferase [Lachnospiraceae bacterium]|nr:phosphate butyryltransferase [Lachnospiraceae bacterium]